MDKNGQNGQMDKMDKWTKKTNGHYGQMDTMNVKNSMDKNYIYTRIKKYCNYLIYIWEGTAELYHHLERRLKILVERYKIANISWKDLQITKIIKKIAGIGRWQSGAQIFYITWCYGRVISRESLESSWPRGQNTLKLQSGHTSKIIRSLTRHHELGSCLTCLFGAIKSQWRSALKIDFLKK